MGITVIDAVEEAVGVDPGGEAVLFFGGSFDIVVAAVEEFDEVASSGAELAGEGYRFVIAVGYPHRFR